MLVTKALPHDVAFLAFVPLPEQDETSHRTRQRCSDPQKLDMIFQLSGLRKMSAVLYRTHLEFRFQPFMVIIVYIILEFLFKMVDGGEGSSLTPWKASDLQRKSQRTPHSTHYVAVSLNITSNKKMPTRKGRIQLAFLMKLKVITFVTLISIALMLFFDGLATCSAILFRQVMEKFKYVF